MIEYVISPGDMDQWHPAKDHCFYLETFGETSPQMSSGYSQVPVVGEDREKNYCANLAPLYEYFWSLGYIDANEKCGPDSWGGELADTAAEVYLYFPTTGGWRVEELLATIKYLCPGREHASVLQSAAHMFATVQPIVEDASKLAMAGTMVPGAAPIAASTAVLLDVIARLKVTSVPPESAYVWSVQKVARHVQGDGLLQGVKWTISKKLFVEFGSRLTGSIAVNIVPSTLQLTSGKSECMQPKRMPIRARAVMHLHPGLRKDKCVLLPETGCLELAVEPKASEAESLEHTSVPKRGSARR